MTAEEENSIRKSVDKVMVELARDHRIVASLLKGEKLCDHPDSWLTGYGNNFSEPFSMVLCTCCLLQGPKGKDYADAKELFWKKEALDRGRYLKLMKEMKPMSTDDYKRGVEDATKPVTEKSLYYFTEVNDLLKSRRKSLLTKKVTKWVNVFSCAPSVSDPASAHEYVAGPLHNSEISARLCSQSYGIVGTYPLEIEVPL